MSKLVVIVQCELVTRRCSGYNCMKAFTRRSGKMEGYTVLVLFFLTFLRDTYFQNNLSLAL